MSGLHYPSQRNRRLDGVSDGQNALLGIWNVTGLALATKLLSTLLGLHTHTKTSAAFLDACLCVHRCLTWNLNQMISPEYPLMEDEVHPHSIELLRFNSQRARVDWLLSV